METSYKIQFSEDDPNHHDHHQEPHENEGHPPSTGMFLTTIFHLKTQVLYIFGNLRQIKFNEDEHNHHNHDLEPQDD